MEPGFLFELVDEVVEVDDADSIAGAWALRDLVGGWHGGSSGTNLIAWLELAESMRARGERGSIVSLLGDRGERYAQSLFNAGWPNRNDIDVGGARAAVARRVEG